jgi:hypothetical protein
MSPGRFLGKMVGTDKHCSLVTLSSDSSIPFITDGEEMPHETRQPFQVLFVIFICRLQLNSVIAGM